MEAAAADNLYIEEFGLKGEGFTSAVWPQCWLCDVCAVGHVGCCVRGGYPVGVSISSSPAISPWAAASIVKSTADEGTPAAVATAAAARAASWLSVLDKLKFVTTKLTVRKTAAAEGGGGGGGDAGGGGGAGGEGGGEGGGLGLGGGGGNGGGGDGLGGGGEGDGGGGGSGDVMRGGGGEVSGGGGERAVHSSFGRSVSHSPARQRPCWVGSEVGRQCVPSGR